ncbi:hypothetical protein D9615_008501 [Tricholomella constricta]|uniref:FAD-binding PCMH-type domain-containing protein n=1 Tax=Tricholomella constricta TaxID=117010 RepID=A0A8H5H3U5_9AGAR|nr:hypothetical protein D9615_008501 [Tricholomella constricta]
MMPTSKAFLILTPCRTGTRDRCRRTLHLNCLTENLICASGRLDSLNKAHQNHARIVAVPLSTMLGFTSILLLLGTSRLVFAADIKDSLDSLGIVASFPGDVTYTSASSPFNLRFSVQPAAITYPKTVNDISEILKVGAAENVSVVARSGGHSYIANGLGGRNGALVVDLSNMTNVSIDSAKGIALIETGNRLGDIAVALGDAGRGLPHGSSSGGFGFTSRMWGLTLDTIDAANVVLANGTIARALRGSASSFAIVTSIEVRTFPAPPTGTIFQYSWDGLNTTTAAQIIATIQRFVQVHDIPPHLGGEINLFRGAVRGTISISFAGGWYAHIEKLNATVNPLLRQLPTTSRTSFFTGTYLETAENLAGGSLDTKSAPDGHDTFYAKSLLTPESSPMSDAAILAYTTYLANEGFSAEVGWFIQMELYGGKNSAINAVSPDATAFAHRRSIFSIQFYSSAPNNVPPYPQSGFTFLDGLVESIISNSPQDWNYG